MDDVRAVMDAAGSERAVLLGVSEGAPLSMVFAATHPERTAALIFVGGEVKEILEDDWPLGQETREEYEGSSRGSSPARSSGDRPKRVWFAPSKEYDPAVMEWRRGASNGTAASPAAAVAFMRLGSEIDVRYVAPSIHVPTLVLHVPGDPIVPLRTGPLARRADRGSPLRRARRAGPRALVRRRRSGRRRGPRFPDRISRSSRTREDRWQPSSSPTSSARRNGRRSSATRSGRLIARAPPHHGAYDPRPATADGRSIRRATGSWRPSTGRRGRSAAPVAVRDASAGLGIPVRSGLHTGEVEVSGTSWPASRCTSDREWLRWPGPARCSSPPPCATSSPAQASSSKTAACTSSRASTSRADSTPCGAGSRLPPLRIAPWLSSR